MTSAPISDYPRSYYAATSRGAPHLTALDHDETCDVCVIGAGYTGLSAAYHLAERGYRVIVLEAGPVGFGASGRNGGQLYRSQRLSQRELETMLGQDWAHRLWNLGLESAALVKGLIATHAIECDLKPGILHGAWKASDVASIRHEVDHLTSDYGCENLSFVTREEIAGMVGTSRYHGGSLDMGCAHLHPLNFALGLARAAIGKGARIYEGTRALGIDYGDSISIKTAHGTVTSNFVALACNAYLGKLEPRIASKIMPINNFVIATEPLGEAQARALIRDDVAVADTKFVIDYYRLSADRRLLFGGGENYSTKFPEDIAAFVRKPMLRVFPQLENTRIDYAWGGALAITLPRMPSFGRLADNAYYAQGYSGQGVNMATLGGKLMAEAIAGHAERFDWMANVRIPDFPGGMWLRYPALVAGMLFYAMRDRLPW